MSRRVLSRPTLVIGSLMMVLGLVLAGPSLWSALRYRLVPGILLEVFPQPLDDGRIRLTVVYEYEIVAGDLPRVDGPARALGYARSDRFGQPLPDLVLSDAEALDFIARVRDEPPEPTQVFYDPDAPLETARAWIVTGGPLWRSLPHLGMVLLLTPPLTWCLLLLLRSGRRTTRRQPR